MILLVQNSSQNYIFILIKMYYHVILLYVLVILLIIATVYYQYIENVPIRLTLYAESGLTREDITASTTFTDFFEFDNVFEKIMGKVKFYVSFEGITKNAPLTARISDSKNNVHSKEVVLTDDRTLVLEANFKTHVATILLQAKTTGTPQLLTIDIEYNF
jgi:hypothetical protein